MHWSSRLIALVLVGTLAPIAYGQDLSRPEIIKRVKAATAFVHADDSSGTAFCVDEVGLFITNQHVVKSHQEVTLVLHSGTKDQEVLTARVIRSDKILDLALLKVVEKVKCKSLPLGSSDDLSEQDEVLAAGFPFGKLLSEEKRDYPTVSINSGKISSLRQKDGKLERIQMDAVVNPGNSGGPVLDAKGKVIGVVVGGVPGATVNFAIPIGHVHSLVSVPEIAVQIPVVNYADRYKSVPIEVTALAPLPAREPYEVELFVGPSDGKERSFRMKFEKGAYRVVTAPLIAHEGPAMLKATLTYPTGNLSGLIADRSFKVGDESVKLSIVRRVRFGAEPAVELADDKALKGKLTGLEELSLVLGSDTLKLNPAHSQELSFAQEGPQISVEYRVVIRSGKKELARLRDVLAFEGAPGSQKPKGTDTDSKSLDGFWVLEKSEAKAGLSWPQHPEEAIYIEENKVMWVKKNGKVPTNPPEATIEVDAEKTPHRIILTIRSGTARGQKWRAIYKIEGDRLTIATDCDEDTCPTLFTVRATSGSAQFVRTYRRITE